LAHWDLLVKVMEKDILRLQFPHFHEQDMHSDMHYKCQSTMRYHLVYPNRQVLRYQYDQLHF